MTETADFIRMPVPERTLVKSDICVVFASSK